MKREKFEKETELYKKNNSLMINNEIIFSKIIILLINLKSNQISNQISKFITDAKNKWFNMFKLSFKDVNNENQANEIIDKSYYNLSLSMNKVLNLEEEVICDFEIPYFYDVNNLKIYETTSKVEIYTYISNQFYKIFRLFYCLIENKLFSGFLITYPNKYILNINEENEKIKEMQNRFKNYYENIHQEIKKSNFFYTDLNIHNYLFINIFINNFNLKELLEGDNYLVILLREKFGFYNDLFSIISNNKFLFDELNNYLKDENNYGFKPLQHFIKNKLKLIDYSENQIKDISILFPEIDTFNYYIGEEFLCKIRLTQRLNKMFEQYSNIQLDCYGITYLINEYINQDLIYQNNSHFKNNNLKYIINTIFKNELFYRIFHLENNFILTIINLLEKVNYKLNQDNPINYSIKINHELNKGNTIQYININSLNEIIDFENITFDSYKKQNKEVEIEITLTLNMSLLKIDGDENKFIKSLKERPTNIGKLNKKYEKWFSDDLINPFVENNSKNEEEIKENNKENNEENKEENKEENNEEKNEENNEENNEEKNEENKEENKERRK